MQARQDGRLSDLFVQRSFVRFWLARLSGTTSLQMLMVALAWHMYDVTSSAWDLGLVGLLQGFVAIVESSRKKLDFQSGDQTARL